LTEILAIAEAIIAGVVFCGATFILLRRSKPEETGREWFAHTIMPAGIIPLINLGIEFGLHQRSLTAAWILGFIAGTTTLVSWTFLDIRNYHSLRLDLAAPDPKE
jgi:hypothetical protein